VDIDASNKAKKEMARALTPSDPRVLNRLGAFASLFEAKFPNLEDPVLVMKMEEPGSKQLLAFQHGAHRTIGFDLVHHLLNDVIVMGAQPLAVLDCIVTGKINKDIVVQIVTAMAEACHAQGCTLVGGETSEQPGVLAPEHYILSAAAIGVVERKKIIDGSRIAVGDRILGIASNGLHTNGYSLVRKLIEQNPSLPQEEIGNGTFLDAILKPHLCYYHALKDSFLHEGITGLAHITGGGIADNTVRILPKSVSAYLDLAKIKVLPVFKEIKKVSVNDDTDMLRTFNMGIGLVVIVTEQALPDIMHRIQTAGYETYEIGEVKQGDGSIQYSNAIIW
jgi:phosphoribosylformylglycinamidine cyclo-ligase